MAKVELSESGGHALLSAVSVNERSQGNAGFLIVGETCSLATELQKCVF